MANVFITPEGQATTSVELSLPDAGWLADQLDRLSDPSDSPAAREAAMRIRQAAGDSSEPEVDLTGAELDSVRRVFELEPQGAGSQQLAQLRAEIERWLS
jgi:hypothetical protein